MACKQITQPSRTRRTVLQLGLEQQPGCLRTAGLEQMLLYENMNPTQAEVATIKLTRARNGLASEGVLPALATYQINGSMYMFGSGVPNVAPAWAKILRACGWHETRYVKDSGPDVTGVTVIGSTSDNVDMDAGDYDYYLSIIPADMTAGETKLTQLDSVTLGAPGHVTIDWSACAAVADVINNGGAVRLYRTLAGGTASFFIAQISEEMDYEDDINDDNLADPAPTEIVTGTVGCLWLPQNAFHDSLTIRSYLDSRMYPATGVRGTMAFNGAAGEPFRGDFDLRGVYNNSNQEDNPTPLATPGFPPRLIKTGLKIRESGEGNDDYISVCKSIGVVLGTTVSERMDTNADEGLIEYGIYEEFSPRINLSVEVDGAKDWIDSMKKGLKYRVSFCVSPVGEDDSDAGTRMKVIAGDDPANTLDDTDAGSQFGCQLVSTPKFDDSNGQRVFRLEFEPGQIDAGHLIDQHFLKFAQI